MCSITSYNIVMDCLTTNEKGRIEANRMGTDTDRAQVFFIM